MKYNKKIIFLAIFLLLTPGFLPYGISSSKGTAKNNQVSHAELCCCGNDVNTCHDCCCSIDSATAGNDYHAESDGLQKSDNTGNRLFIINACGSESHDIFVAPELNYFVLLSSYDNCFPVSISNDIITPGHREPRLVPPYKPPKS